MHDLELNKEMTHPDNPYMTVMRVPGGWIYRFFDQRNVATLDGGLCDDYQSTAVFIPFHNEFMEQTKSQPHPWEKPITPPEST